MNGGNLGGASAGAGAGLGGGGIAGGTAGFGGYVPPALEAGIRLFLDANEGRPGRAVVEALAAAEHFEAMRRYPRATALEADIAALPAPGLGAISPASVLVTAGSDDAIARACRLFLGRGDRLLVFEPSFEMFSVSSRLVGAEPLGLPWPEGESFPLAAAIDTARSAGVKALALASPANPTGAAVSPDAVLELADALPEVSVWVDGAYGEFAERDNLGPALSRPNTLAMRTFSKAYGLAGMRLGWVAGAAPTIGALRAAGAPYPVGGLSVLAGLAARSAEGRAQMEAFVARVREERELLRALLTRLGARATASEANFVFARVRSAALFKAALAKAGIAIRSFPGRPGLEDAVRISCPGEAGAWSELAAAVEAAKEWL